MPTRRRGIAIGAATAALAAWALFATAANAEQFAKVETITVPASGNATPYPSTIDIDDPSGMNVADVSVRIRGLDHTLPDDLDLLLQVPGGGRSILMSDVGGVTALNDADLTIDDDAAGPFLDSGPIPAGGGPFQPTEFGGADTFGPPAPAGPYVANFANIEGGKANGSWRLFVVDDAGGNAGAIDIGWSLNLTLERPDSTPITVPAGAATAGSAAPYPSTIGVSGVNGTVDDVDVELVDVSHTFTDDLDVLLAGPGGQHTFLMSDAGGTTDATADDIVFDQSAPGFGAIPDAGPIAPGTFIPSAYETPDVMPAPAPSAPYFSSFGVFSGTAPDGTWSLFVADDGVGDVGSIANGWRLAVKASDKVVPDTAIDSGPSGPTNDPTPSFGFSANEAMNQFQCRVDGAAFGPCSSAHTTEALTEGPHTLDARAIDPALNVDASPASRAFSVDLTAPETLLHSRPSGATRDSTPTFRFTGREQGTTFECALDGGSFGACSGPGNQHTTGALPDGVHFLAVRAIDPAGNADGSPAVQFVLVDGTVPKTKITESPKNRVKTGGKRARVAYEFKSEAGAEFDCVLNTKAITDCESPLKVRAGMGRHDFSVRATDAAGNVEDDPATDEFRVVRRR